MIVEPVFADFAAAYEAGRPQIVSTRLVADLETPVSAYLKLAGGRANAFLFESVEGGAVRGRYSFIGLKPDLIWRCHGDVAAINRHALVDGDAFIPAEGPPLSSLRRLIEECHIDLPPGMPPMAAGLFGYMGYDMVRQMERLPAVNPDTLGIPDAIFLRPTIVAIFDTIADSVTIVTPAWPRDGMDAKVAYERARERLSETIADFDRSLSGRRMPTTERVALPEPASNMPKARFLEIVERGKEYIRAGDVFQVVLAQRFAVPFSLPPFALYRALRRINPSPFLFFLDFDGFSVVGSSPEILVRLRGSQATIRPLAGTRPRGATAAEDASLAKDLLADPKELAEHLMLLDLGRNDMGRIAEIGSVRVTEQMVIEYYSHVMHIVSNVEGRLKPGLDALDVLVAGFPAGTVSGAPKVRAMEIIEELEPDRRGTYAGCVGYFAANGDMDTCITLRTGLVKDRTLFVQAGGGIVTDSDPEAEYQESRNKARALIRAAEEALRFAERR